jgi:hypothetical protein
MNTSFNPDGSFGFSPSRESTRHLLCGYKGIIEFILETKRPNVQQGKKEVIRTKKAL